MKKKVVHIIHNLEIGGVETAVLSSLESLNQSYDFTLVCIGSIKPLVLSKVSPEIIKNTLEINSISRIINFIYILKKKSPFDIVISSLWKAHLFHFILNFFVPIKKSVIFLHSGQFAHFFDKLGILLGIKIASEIWTDSDATSNFITPYNRSKKNIVKISFLLSHFLAKSHIFKNKNVTKFIFLGRLSKVKRLDLIIHFINELHKKKLQVTLDIFGPDNSVWDTLKSQIDSLALNTSIKYRGSCSFEETQTVLSNYDAFVLMSDYEGMSISTVQAMETGLLCFLRNVGEIANYGENMVNAVILNSLEPDDWSEFIENSVKVLTNESLQKTILSNSTAKFANQLTYTQDILQNLERLNAPHNRS